MAPELIIPYFRRNLKKINSTTCLFLVFACLAGCEKTISFKLDESLPKLVVDGSIENAQAPVIILSRSLDYFSQITPAILLSSFIHQAVISISNGVKTQTLKEYSYNASGNIKLFYYSTDSSNQASVFVGEAGKSYVLKISVDGKSYNASTTIPASGTLVDSLWWKKSPGNPDTTKVILESRVTDPPGLGNYIRYFTKTGQGPFLPGLNSVFDDQIIDGTSYNIAVDRGIDRNETIDLENYAFFTRGDTVTVKFCNIDKATFDFWRTMEYSYSSIGNPFSTPTKVLGNISEGALGYFGGYAVQYKSLIIPK